MASMQLNQPGKIYTRHFAKRFIMMLSLALILEIIIFSAFLQQEKMRTAEVVDLLHQSEATLLHQAFETELQKVQSDLLVLKDSNDIAAFLHAPNSEEAVTEITRIFTNFQAKNQSYSRLTLLDPAGAPVTRVGRSAENLITLWPDEMATNMIQLLNAKKSTIQINRQTENSTLLFTIPLQAGDDMLGGYLQLEYQLTPFYLRLQTHTDNHPESFYGLYSQDQTLYESAKKDWVVSFDNIRRQISEGQLPSESVFIHAVAFNLDELITTYDELPFVSTDQIFLIIQNKQPSFFFLTNHNIQTLMLIESILLLGWIMIAFYLARIASIRDSQQNQTRLMSHVFESLSESLVIADSHAKILYANPAFCSMMGYSQDELINLPLSHFQSKHHAPAFYRNLWEALQEEGTWEGKLWDHTRQGDAILKWVKISKIMQANKSTLYFGVYNDIDPASESKLDNYRMRYYDLLTDLPNESLLPRLISEAIKSHEKSDRKFGIATIQLQNFCSEDSSLELKNSLIKAIADRLVKNIDPARGILSRSGLKEFTLLYPSLNTQDDFFASLARTKQQLDQPFNLVNGQICKLDYDIGLSLYPTDGNRALDLMGQARMRIHNKQNLFLSDKNRSAAYIRYFNIDSALRNAVTHEELFIEYQPQVDPTTSQPCALEALLRWQHPDLGRVSPSEFIPIAEANGSIISIGEWVLMQVFSFQNRLVQKGIARIPISINISMIQLEDPHFYEQLRLMLEVYDFSPGLIELEITESLLMKDIILSKARIHAIKALGVKISIDDFGTGYSSLAYLKELHADKIKIDRLFIKDYPQMDDGALLASISQLLHGMSYTIVMEGVETKLQMNYIQNLGIDIIQGYYYSKPRSAASTIVYLTKSNPTEA